MSFYDQMVNKNEIQKREVPKIQYYIYCPVCEQEIKGNAPSQVKYNMTVHLKQKHNEEYEGKEE